MRKFLLAALVVAGIASSGGTAQAWQWGHQGPWAQTAAFPCANPPGYYTNTYSFAWQYPWFAYYNYSHGPYANWAAGGGVAHYTTCGPNGNCGYAPPSAGVMGGSLSPCTLAVNVPADAKLLFNGTVATATGAVRTFTTPPLQPGQEYGYELTIEVMQNGKLERATEKVVVRAGAQVNVTLSIPTRPTTIGTR